MPEELEEYTGEYIDDRAVRRGRMSSVPIVTVLLIIINVVVFIYVEMTGSSEDTQHIFDMGASYAPAILEDHEYYRLITHFFLHFGVAHITNNMLSLLVLGYATENAVGHVRFAVIYMLSGFMAGVVSLIYNQYIQADPAVACGASGAIFGLAGALLVLVIRGNKGRRGTEVIRYVIYLVLSLYSGFVDPSIDNAAHVGGFIFGLLICLLTTQRMHYFTADQE